MLTENIMIQLGIKSIHTFASDSLRGVLSAKPRRSLEARCWRSKDPRLSLVCFGIS